MPIENVTRFNDQFFRFHCNLGGVTYSSGITFENKCTDEQFDEILPSIKYMIEWINANIDEINLQTKEKMPPNANINEFDRLEITSISLHFESGTLYANLSYGFVYWDSEQNSYIDDGTYLISTIKDKKVFDVYLNS